MRSSEHKIYETGFYFLLIGLVILLFYIFTKQNFDRIQEQNQVYASDSAIQIVDRIEDQFKSSEELIQAYAFFLEREEKISGITSDLLERIEKNSPFDSVTFTTRRGVIVSPGGEHGDATGMSYYTGGMEGKSGVATIMSKRGPNKHLLGFYTPLRYDGKVSGVLMGGYISDSFLRSLLETSYFGMPSEVFLCRGDGQIIASSSGKVYTSSVYDVLQEEASVDSGTIGKMEKIFGEGGNGVFTCAESSQIDNLCVINLEKYNCFLVQTFPQAITGAMVKNANMAGVQLEIGLLLLFAVYALWLVMRARRQKKIMQSDISRKERQYRLAITTNALCDFEFNVTRDLVEKDVWQKSPGGPISRLELVGLQAPCKASELFRAWNGTVLPESREDFANIMTPEYFLREYEKGNYVIDLDYWRDDPEGGEKCVRQSVYLSRDELSGDVMALAVSRDITEQISRQRAQTRALQDALDLARHASEAKSTFLSSMSHDIRTPMNAIIGFTTIASNHLDNREQVRDCLHKVLSSSNHLLSLINDILDMSRIESGKLQVKEQECNISEVMHNLVTIIQPQIKAKQMRLFIDTFDVTNEDIITDPLKLNQVFINILSNAVKYTPAGGEITLRLAQKPAFRHGYAEYIFEVEDNGMGMDEEFVEHIFEPFTRAATTTKIGIQGTGLGMAITKNIVDLLNGRIKVESKPGVGSKFTVSFTFRVQEESGGNESGALLEGRRVMVVDDDFHVCRTVADMLEKLGAETDWTMSGKEAACKAKLAVEQGRPFDIFIVDWQMPVMNGVETTRELRSIAGEDAPIIILTAYEWTDIEEKAKEIGVTAFCAKPLFMSDLKNALRSLNKQEAVKDEEWNAPKFAQNARVLVVEDIDMNREIAEYMLTESGFMVETAPDGTDAVEMVRSSPENYYDAILMDVQMPTMNGYEATRAIRNLERNDVRSMPIIAMTANAMEEDKAEALKCGMNDHIAKPIDIKVFFEVLRKFFQ